MAVPGTSDLHFAQTESEHHITGVCEVKQTIFGSQTEQS